MANGLNEDAVKILAETLSSVPTGGVTISDLPQADSLNMNDELVICDAGDTKKITLQQLFSYFSSMM